MEPNTSGFNTPRTHTCPGPACSRTIPYERLACSIHWYQLPQALRGLIYRTWGNGKGAGSDEHTEALKQAVAHWNGAA